MLGYLNSEDVHLVYQSQEDHQLGMQKYFSEGDVIKARILNIEFKNNQRIQLTMKEPTLGYDKIWKEEFKADLSKYFKVVPEDDVPIQ